MKLCRTCKKKLTASTEQILKMKFYCSGECRYKYSKLKHKVNLNQGIKNGKI